VSGGVVGQRESPGNVSGQFAAPDRIPVFHKVVVDLVAVDEVPEVFAPQTLLETLLQRGGAHRIVSSAYGIARQGGKPADRLRIGVHVGVDRRAEGIAATKSVLAAGSIDGRDGIF